MTNIGYGYNAKLNSDHNCIHNNCMVNIVNLKCFTGFLIAFHGCVVDVSNTATATSNKA